MKFVELRESGDGSVCCVFLLVFAKLYYDTHDLTMYESPTSELALGHLLVHTLSGMCAL